MSDQGSLAPIEAIYTERNEAVAVLVSLAQRLGYSTWFSCGDDSDWPIVFVELPNGGQVSWHIPAAEMSDFFPINGKFPNIEGKWDGHTNAQKSQRLRREAKYGPWDANGTDMWEF